MSRIVDVHHTRPLEDDRPRSPTPMIQRRQFLSNSLGLGLSASLPFNLDGFSTAGAESGFPFSPSRTVVLPRRLGRRHLPARRVIERKVEELAGMELYRLPEAKVEALLQVAGAVTEYYGIGERLELWAERIPIQEAFSSQSCGTLGVLSYWQPREPVASTGSPLDWWLFLSPEPIGWGSLDGIPVHALVAHVSRTDYVSQLNVMHRVWGSAWDLILSCGKTDFWPRLARLDPVEAARILNDRFASIPKGPR
jgi:hypothetical protein